VIAGSEQCGVELPDDLLVLQAALADGSAAGE
jgi:hypothetical protein